MFASSTTVPRSLNDLSILLGGYHLLAFLGSIGHLMSGSGLEELWSLVCDKSSIAEPFFGSPIKCEMPKTYSVLLTGFGHTIISQNHLDFRRFSLVYWSKQMLNYYKSSMFI